MSSADHRQRFRGMLPLAGLAAARLGETVDVQKLKLRVADAYVNGLRAGGMLKVAESHVESLAAHAHDVDNLHEQGMVARSDLLSARVALADARQKALQAAGKHISLDGAALLHGAQVNDLVATILPGQAQMRFFEAPARDKPVVNAIAVLRYETAWRGSFFPTTRRGSPGGN